MHGRNQGTHGRGARKKAKGSGHRGGIGMAGSGKRADHKKTLITKLYGNKYFGKQGLTSRKTERDKRKIKPTTKVVLRKKYLLDLILTSPFSIFKITFSFIEFSLFSFFIFFSDLLSPSSQSDPDRGYRDVQNVRYLFIILLFKIKEDQYFPVLRSYLA